MQSNQASVDCDGDGRKVEVIEEHRQVVVQTLYWLEVELQYTTGHGRKRAGLSAFTAPQLHTKAPFRPLQWLF